MGIRVTGSDANSYVYYEGRYLFQQTKTRLLDLQLHYDGSNWIVKRANLEGGIHFGPHGQSR